MADLDTTLVSGIGLTAGTTLREYIEHGSYGDLASLINAVAIELSRRGMPRARELFDIVSDCYRVVEAKRGLER